MWKKAVLLILPTLILAIVGVSESEEVFSPVIKTNSTKILFLGDAMFDRDIRRIGELYGYQSLWGESGENFKKYDAVVFNLEGPITDYSSVSLGSTVDSPENTTFTFSRNILTQFPTEGNFLVNIGNNHILDFGYAGLLSTEKALDFEGIKFFGDIAKSPITKKYAKLGDSSVAVVSFNEFLGGGISSVIKEIRSLKKRSFFVVVYTHWGAEYKNIQPQYIKELAHRFIDAGADLVVGSHPHVVGQVETYKGKRIYYSLGNFIFDQYWSSKVSCGTALEATVFKDGSTKYNLTNTLFEGGRVKWGSVNSKCGIIK